MPDDETNVDPRSPLLERLSKRWRIHLDDGQRAAVVAWGSFAVTFAGVRGLTHWIKDGHGPSVLGPEHRGVHKPPAAARRR